MHVIICSGIDSWSVPVSPCHCVCCSLAFIVVLQFLKWYSLLMGEHCGGMCTSRVTALWLWGLCLAAAVDQTSCQPTQQQLLQHLKPQPRGVAFKTEHTGCACCTCFGAQCIVISCRTADFVYQLWASPRDRRLYMICLPESPRAEAVD